MNYLFADFSALELFFVIFHHVLGSTSLSIVKFSIYCAVWNSLFILLHQVLFVKYFFEIFLNNLFNQPLSFGQLY